MSGHTHIHTHRTTTVTLAAHARRGLIINIIIIYRIAGNVCGNYILRFVVKSKIFRINVCGLHNTYEFMSYMREDTCILS